MASDVKWIKITTDIFDDEKIRLIEAMPDAYAIITVWFKLLCLAGKQNNSGVFMMNDRIAYTDEMLATIFRMNKLTVSLALRTFEDFGMIEMVDNVITIPNWGKHQTLDAYERKKERDRLYQAEKRQKQRLLAQKSSDTSSDTSTEQSSYVVPLEEDKEKDNKNKDIDTKRINYQEIVDMYHSICLSYPRIKSLSESRKKAIKARLKQYTIDDIREVFQKAEASDFMKGKNDTNWSANFDWMMKDANMAKILDGNYDNRGQKKSRANVGLPEGVEDPLEGLFG